MWYVSVYMLMYSLIDIVSFVITLCNRYWSIRCYSSLLTLNVWVKGKCCSSVPLTDQALCLNHQYSQVRARSGQLKKKKREREIQCVHSSLFQLFDARTTAVFNPDLVKVVHSWYTWLHQRAGHFNTPSPVCLLSVWVSIKAELS